MKLSERKAIGRMVLVVAVIVILGNSGRSRILPNHFFVHEINYIDGSHQPLEDCSSGKRSLNSVFR